MSGLPNQTLESWQKTLKRVVSLAPEHISAYSLIIEEGTPFFEKYGDSYSEEQEEIDREIYHFTKKYLKENGYERYEISNYAKSGFECRHNCSYWMGIPYLGLGLGASSYEIVNDKYIRSMNASTFKEYEKGFLEETQVLTVENRIEEFMFLGLRLMQGVSVTAFEELFQTKMEDIYGKVLDKLSKEKLIEKNEDYYHLTEYGIDISNYVLSEFLLG
jgi:oxygen-independent coproporphyrinogen-3 oxidase